MVFSLNIESQKLFDTSKGLLVTIFSDVVLLCMFFVGVVALIKNSKKINDSFLRIIVPSEDSANKNWLSLYRHS